MSNRHDLAARHAAILESVREVGEVDVAALAAAHGVTPQTIRKDLNRLAERSLLARVHGGAAIGSGIANMLYDERRRLAADAKARIGAAAAQLIPEGASLFINIGTTTEAAARHLAHHHKLMVVTNNLNVVDQLAGRPGLVVIAVGGEVRASDRAVVGALAHQFLHNFRVDYALIGASGLSLEGDLLDFDPDEVQVSRSIIRNAREVILVADAGKIGRAAPLRIAGIEALRHLVTDRIEQPDLRARILAAGVNLVETG
jgi:DeoR family transcriptional regulator, glycerol-3-phosphate regulon repressor